jgi:uncharacterized protein
MRPAAPPVAVRASPLHGLGVFALAPIARGTRIFEYLGERISHAEADRRYAHKAPHDSHTFLFIADENTVIDAGVGGNEARFVNHACEPNCESVIERSRVFIDALRNIRAGEELTYDYQIRRERDDPPDIDAMFACRCGAARCRGSMLWPERRARAAARISRRCFRVKA